VPVTQLPEAGGMLSFECPRCHSAVSERFYGPCAACRAQLNEKFYKAPEQGTPAPEAARFEPKMHVVPNNVAGAREVDDYDDVSEEGLFEPEG
jgi:hypothetical protein